MEILAYGEDALTLWALKSKLEYILRELNDVSNPSECQAFFRPSFGRRGGDNSSQFGEFDFILLTTDCIYLGESKWDKSSEKIIDGKLKLREEQLLRHRLFKFYIEKYAYGQYKEEWQVFVNESKLHLSELGITKPIAPANSLLAKNLREILKLIRKRYTDLPVIKNVLLYLHNNLSVNHLPQKVGNDFDVVSIDYSEGLIGNYIKL
jgi:hypothetical protein